MDYLDSIATPVPQKTMSPLLLWGLISGVLLLGVFVFIFVSSSGPKTNDQLVALVQRMKSIQTITDEDASKIKDSELSATNTSMDTVLTGAIKETTNALEKNGIKQVPDASPTSKIGKEFDELAAKLIDAELNVRFDRVYSREMAYQLSEVLTEIQTIYDGANSKSLRSSLSTIYDNIEPLQKKLASFTNSTFRSTNEIIAQTRQVTNLVI